MGGVSKSDTNLQLATKEIPGVFGTPESARRAGQAESLLGRQSPLAGLLQNILSGGQTAGEAGFAGTIGDIVGGGGQDLSKVLATNLVSQRQGDIGNILRGGRGQQMEQLGAIRGLLELAGLAMPQVVGGQTVTGRTAPFDPTGVSGTGLDVLLDPIGGSLRKRFPSPTDIF